MADRQRLSVTEREVEQAITALKRGAHLLKYGRRGKPKFCPFRLSSDESTLIWYDEKDEKQLELYRVARIIPGQRTSVFQRYPRPEKEYQSFSLVYDDRSLDLICKDKDEAEVWFTGLKALVGRESGNRRQRNDPRSESAFAGSPRCRRVALSSSFFPPELGDAQVSDEICQNQLGETFSDVVSMIATEKTPLPAESDTQPSETVENSNARTSGSETFRLSLSSAVSSSSQGSCNEDFDNFGDVFIWGEGIRNGVMGGGPVRVEGSSDVKANALLPKVLGALDVQNIACGQRHAVLISKQGEVFSWGEESGGRLGHGVEVDVTQPKLVEALSGKNVQTVACGKYHSCAVTVSGDLYTWGDGSLRCGLLGHESDSSRWIPKKVGGPIDNLEVSFVACGLWHTALLTSTGQLFTFGDGTFGALGHGNRSSTKLPREVETLKELRTVTVACGAWHTAAIADVTLKSLEPKLVVGGKLFTWGDGDRGRLGHHDSSSRLVPERVASLVDTDFYNVACGDNFTVALTTSGHVYTLGSVHGNSATVEKNRGSIVDGYVEEIACGSHHIAVLTSKGEVHTWGKGANGQLGHGDNDDRTVPMLVDFLKDKQVKSIACGSNFTAAVCAHKGISSADNSACSACYNPFNFIRQRHNCYNCGLVFCKACSARKSLMASLAPSRNKPYRVCDDCFSKLQKTKDSISGPRFLKSDGLVNKSSGDMLDGLHLSGILSRLSHAESFKSERTTTFNLKFEANDNRENENAAVATQRSNANSSSKLPSSPFGSLQNLLPFIFPDSKSASQSSLPSPVQGKSPRRSTTPSPSSFSTPDDLKSFNYSLSLEIRNLRVQVEKLTTKSQLLEAELERKANQIDMAAAHAAAESEKSKIAKETIKSLTAQLNEMAEKMLDGQVIDTPIDTNDSKPNDNNRASPKSDSSKSPLSNGTKPEQNIEDEPGVYITLVSLSNGLNELKRVRFSRKRFTEAEAEKWWNENGTMVCERHNVRSVQ